MSSNQSSSKRSSQRRYPPELHERAVRMVEAAIAETGERFGAVSRVAQQLGVGPESVRNWVKQAVYYTAVGWSPSARRRQDE